MHVDRLAKRFKGKPVVVQIDTITRVGDSIPRATVVVITILTMLTGGASGSRNPLFA